MPEIAEVETVRNTLKKSILNKEIKEVKIIYGQMIESDLNDFKRILINQEFIDIKRRGKWLLFELKEYFLLSHLRMEGKFFLKTVNDPLAKHEHIIITFNDNTDLRYHDTRKFGRMNLLKKSELENYTGIKKQGLEPFDEKLDSKYLLIKFKNKRLPIKSLLLDQTIISGLGNIYADEVLFASRINPLTRGIDLNEEDCLRIIDASRKIIKRAIELGGTTIKSYTSSLGVTGRFQQELKVHTKAGENCQDCNSVIERIKVGGRSTYFCPKCQK